MNAGKRRNKKIGYGVVIILVIIIAIVYNAKKSSFIYNELPQLVKTKSNDLYKVHYDSIAVDELKGDVYLKNLTLVADTTRQNELLKNNKEKAPKILLNISIPVVRLTGFKTAKALLSKKIICDKIIISGPSVIAYLYPHKTQKDIKQEGKDFYKHLLGNYELIQANEVEVINANVVCRNVLTNQSKFEAFNSTINLKDIRIDSLANDDTTRTFFCKEIFFKTNKLVAGEKDKTIDAWNASYSTGSNKFSIGRIDYDTYKSGGSIKSSMESITVDGFEVKGPVEALLVSINNFTIDKSSFEIKQSKNKAKQPTQKSKAYTLLPVWLKRFSLNTLKADNISFKQVGTNAKQQNIKLGNTSININKVHLDSTSSLEQPLTKLFDELNINNPSVTINSKDGFYQFSFSKLSCNTRDNTIRFKDFFARPVHTEEAFARRAKVRSDRYEVKLNNIVCRNVDFNKLVKGEIDIMTIETSNNFFKVFLDISYPPAHINKLGKYPNQLLFKMKFPVNVGKLVMSDTYVEYKERNARSDSSGRVTFEKSNLVVTNITNRPKGRNDICKWDFTASLLGKVSVRSTMNFFLNDHRKGKFDIKASIDATEATVFNIISRPIALLNFDKGNIRSAGFNFSGDNYNVQGTFNMNYDNLKITLLKKKDNDKVKKKDLLSFITNLLVKSSNKRKAGNQTIGVMYKRDIEKSFFYTIWHAALKGITDMLVIVI